MVLENYKTITQQDSRLVTTSSSPSTKQKRKIASIYFIMIISNLSGRSLHRKCRDLSRARTNHQRQQKEGDGGSGYMYRYQVML